MRASAAATCLESAREAQRRCDWATLLFHAERAAEAAREAGDATSEGAAIRLRAIANEATGGAVDDVTRDLRRAVALLRAGDDRRLLAYAESSLAGQLIHQGHGIEALGLIDSAESALLDLGLERDIQRCQHARAWGELIVGDYAKAMDRARASLPLDRAMMSEEGEGWTLQTGALAATFAGDYETAIDHANALLGLRRTSNNTPLLLDAHLIRYRAMARSGDPHGLSGLRQTAGVIDELREPAALATARAILADALLGARPDLASFVARDEAERGRSLAHPWLHAELRNLEARWASKGIRREGGRLVVDLARAGCLPSERLILDYARMEAAKDRAARVEDAAPELCLSRRAFFKLAAALKGQVGGSGPRPRRRRQKISP
jgi:tetratricopeptide (TPR) repeat protein